MMNTQSTQNPQERARQYAMDYVHEMNENGLFKRGLDLDKEHKEILKSYGDETGLRKMDDIVSRLVDEYQKAVSKSGAKPDEKLYGEVLDRDRSRSKVVKTGFFLDEDQFNFIRSLPRAVKKDERRSLSTGLALMVEHAIEIGILNR